MARSAKPRKRSSPVRHSDAPRYVVQIYGDEDITGEDDGTTLRFDDFDDAVDCCAALGIPFFVDAGNKKLVFWFVRTDDIGARSCQAAKKAGYKAATCRQCQNNGVVANGMCSYK